MPKFQLATHLTSLALILLIWALTVSLVVILVGRLKNRVTEDLNATRKALAFSSNRFRAFFDQSSLPKQIFDRSGNCIEVNRAWERLFATSRSEVAGYNILNDEQLRRKGMGPCLEKAFGGEPAESPVIEYDPAEIGKPGRKRRLESFLFPVHDDSGVLKEVALILRDVTDRHEMEERLRSSTERLHHISDAVTALIAYVTPDYRYRFVNGRYEDWFGLKPAEVVGRHVKDVMGDAAFARAEPVLKEAFAGKQVKYENILKGPSGDRRWVEAEYIPDRDESGGVRGLTTITHDITDRKRMVELQRESIDLLETILSVGQSLVSELEIEKVVQKVTDAATQLTRAKYGAFFYNRVDAKGETYTLYSISGVPRERFSRFPMPRNTQLFHATFSGEGIVRSDDITQDPRFGKNAPHFGIPAGHLPVVSYLAVPVVSGNGTVLGGLFFGHHEAGIFSARDEKIVAGLAAQAAIALDNAKFYEKARIAIRTRDEFLSIASHELKTPLTSLKLQTQMRQRYLAQGNLPAFNPDRLNRMVSSDARQIDRLHRLIDDMLDITRISTGKLALIPETFDLCEMVRDVADRCGDQVNAARCQLKVDCPHAVTGTWDRLRLEQVMLNLLTNAIRYGAGKPIHISVSTEKEHALLQVRDEGRGISIEHQQRIFKQFERAVPASEVSGLGLGLYIADQIVAAHHGTIRLRSAPGEGAEFTVELPLSVAEIRSGRLGESPRSADLIGSDRDV